MRRRDRQHKIRTAEDLFLKAVLLLALIVAVPVGVMHLFHDGTATTQVEGTQLINGAVREPSAAAVSSATTSGTTERAPAPPAAAAPPAPTREQIRAFVAAANQAKARQDATMTQLPATPTTTPTTTSTTSTTPSKSH
ncbi:MAG: hypothetical protein JJE46_16500 [Acidimicrobiia bacterium]|nr:hypothetical protein [Acidimicrobiia bacterium]